MTAAPAPTRHLGIDLGGTSIKWALVEHAAGDWRVIDRSHVRTHTADGPRGVVEQLAAVGVDVLSSRPGVTSVGVGVPGAYHPASGTARLIVNIPGDWTDVPVTEPVRQAVGVPVAMINDARAFGLAELRLGAGRGASSLVGIVLGTGVGGAIVIDGKLVTGHEGAAGEVGHHTIDPDGPSCNCGSRGCLEAFIRADRLAEACEAPTAEVAVDRARAGDAAAVAGLERVGRYLGIGMANLITILTPDRVVLGGGVAGAGDLLLRPARDEMRRRIRMTDLADVDVVLAELGIWAGAIGAAVHGAEHIADADADSDAAPAAAAPNGAPR